MSFWNPNPKAKSLNEELSEIRERAMESRRYVIEVGYSNLRTAVVSLLKDEARTKTGDKKVRIYLSNLYYKYENGIVLTDLSKTLNNIKPPYPVDDEIDYYGKRLETYFLSEKLHASYDDIGRCLVLSWGNEAVVTVTENNKEQKLDENMQIHFCGQEIVDM